MIEPHRPVEVCDLPDPPMEPGSVLLETLYSEVCGTDVHLLHGKLAGVPYPIIPGHVSVGRVLETVGPVTDVGGQPILPGQQVTFLDVHETCNHCWYCLVGKQSTRCPSRKVYGITYSAEDGLLGGWSEQVYLKPGVKSIILPETVTPTRLIAAGCALPTALHAIDRAEIRLGDTVVVQGAGPVGINVAMLAKFSGAGKVIVTDPRAHRLEAAARVGADEIVCFDPTDADSLFDPVRQLTRGRGPDITIEACGAPPAVKQGLQMTRDGGRYVIVGHYTDGGEVPINPHLEINQKHLEIRGSWGSDFSHFYRMVQVLDRFGTGVERPEQTSWESLVTHQYNLDETNDALAMVEAGHAVKALICPNGKPT
ncbi:MAG: zinc-binding dehydrogenase [Planctomycetota bacterium]